MFAKRLVLLRGTVLRWMTIAPKSLGQGKSQTVSAPIGLVGCTVPWSQIGKFFRIIVAVTLAKVFEVVTRYAMKEIGVIISTKYQVSLSMIGAVNATQVKCSQRKKGVSKMVVCMLS